MDFHLPRDQSRRLFSFLHHGFVVPPTDTLSYDTDHVISWKVQPLEGQFVRIWANVTSNCDQPNGIIRRLSSPLRSFFLFAYGTRNNEVWGVSRWVMTANRKQNNALQRRCFQPAAIWAVAGDISRRVNLWGASASFSSAHKLPSTTEPHFCSSLSAKPFCPVTSSSASMKGGGGGMTVERKGNRSRTTQGLGL